jgi:putative PIN family toxin of toxin-antitoxin system
MRVVVDTGVFVSAFIQSRGTTGAVLRALRNKKFTAVYTTEILVEIIDVLGRNKFRDKYHIQPDDISAFVNLIRLRGELVIPKTEVTNSPKLTLCRDPKDHKFLIAALASSADYLVTGDKDLLDIVSFESIPILRPAEFLARL